jgi:type VI secretion system protein ImpA
MGSPSTLDFDPLAAPLADQDAHAATAFRELSGKFQELIRPPDPKDPPRDPEKSGWPGVVKLASEALATRVKDLRIACWLTIALAEVRQFAGLRDGLHLINLLIERCWDVLLPGTTPRARGDAIVKMLDDPDYGPAKEMLPFPAQVRLIPVVRGEKEGYGFLHWRGSPNDGVTVDKEDFDRASDRASFDQCQAVAEDIAAVLTELEGLKEALARQAPDSVFGFLNLRRAVQECQSWVNELVTKKRPAEPANPHDSRGESAPQSNGQGDGAGAAAVTATREQAYRKLREAAEVLGRLEPSSPVPCLLELAVQLEKLPFPKLMKTLAEMQLIAALVRDNGVQDQLKENLG